MARGRLISKSLGNRSRKFLLLHKKAKKLGDFAQALYPLLVANTDDFGRLLGDAFSVKFDVFSTSPHKEEDFEAVLRCMDEVDLIQLYWVKGKRYMQIINFDNEQPNLHKRSKSLYPELPQNKEDVNSSGNLRESPGISGNLPVARDASTPNSELRTPKKNSPPLYPPPPGGNECSQVEMDQASFDLFWQEYPRKVSKLPAERVWKKLKPGATLFSKIMAGLEQYRKVWNDPQYIPYPSTWLNQRRWEDEVIPFGRASPAIPKIKSREERMKERGWN